MLGLIIFYFLFVFFCLWCSYQWDLADWRKEHALEGFEQFMSADQYAREMYWMYFRFDIIDILDKSKFLCSIDLGMFAEYGDLVHLKDAFKHTKYCSDFMDEYADCPCGKVRCPKVERGVENGTV